MVRESDLWRLSVYAAHRSLRHQLKASRSALLLLTACGSGASDTAADCRHTAGRVDIVLMGAWGDSYEEAADVTIQPEGEDGYRVATQGSSVSVELEAGDYLISMEKNASACLTFEPVALTVRACGSHSVELEVDCPLSSD